MKKLIFIFCLVCLFITSMLWAADLSGIIIAGGGGTVSAVPAAPTGVSATAGNAQNTVTWTASSGSTSCNLYWKSGSSMSGNCTGNGTKVIGVSSPDVITSLTNGTTYYYMMTCQNAAGESGCSTEVNATPTGVTAPTAPTVTCTAANGSISGSWSPVSGATSYQCWCDTSNPPATSLGACTSPESCSGSNGTPLYMQTEACDTGGCSAKSSVTTATPSAPVVNFLNDANIIAAYSFENNLNDSSSKGLNLTAGSMPTSFNTATDIKWGTYSIKSSVSSAQTGPYVSNSSIPGYASYTGLTAFGWLNWSSHATNYPAVMVASGWSMTPYTSWMLGIAVVSSNVKAQFDIRDSGGTSYVVTGNTTLSSGTNYFIAGVWDGSYMHIYIGPDTSSLSEDATPVAYSGTPTTGTGAKLMVFEHPVGSYWINGYIDEIGVFNRAFSSSELTSVYTHRIDGSN